MRLSNKQYAELLDKAIEKARGDDARKAVIREFVKLLSEDGKVSKLSDVLSHFNRIWNKRHGVLDVSIESADKESAKFGSTFADKKVSLTVKENKSLLGGSILKIGDYLIDTSVKSKINALRQ